MALSKEQKDLLSAIRNYHVDKIKTLLEKDGVNPNFLSNLGRTPLHEAVLENDLTIIKMLVKAGADVGMKARDGTTPLELAKELQDEGELNFNPIIRYLTGQSPKTSQNLQGPKKPVFTANTLAETFEPSKWVGNIKGMQELWEDVPTSLKKKFNFAAALSEARQQTLKNRSPGKIGLKKPDSPPAP